MVVQILLLIKEYPQQWQTPYVFRQPINSEGLSDSGHRAL